MAMLVLASISIAEAEAYTVDPALIQTVQGYAAETHHGATHVDRWNRVLDAFGVINHTSSMTAEQAQVMADKFNPNRWNPVVDALTALEAAQQQQQQQDQQAAVNPQATQYTVDPALIQTVQGYAAETQHGAAHVERWNRVLDAFGVIQHTSSMTAEQAQQMADNFSAKRWNPVVEALTALEAAQQQGNPNACNWDDPNYVNPPSCYASQTQVTPQKFNELKQRFESNPIPNILEHIGGEGRERYQSLVRLNTSITGSIASYERTAQQVFISNLEFTIENYENLLNSLKRLVTNTPYESCVKPNTTCTVHPNGQLKNYTHTEDSVTVYGYTIHGLTTILIFDDKGNYISKEYKYGENRDTYTTYHKDHTTGYYLPVVNTYTEYRSDGTKMYEIQYVHASDPNYTVYEHYFWDNENLKGKYEKRYDRIYAALCYDTKATKKLPI